MPYNTVSELPSHVKKYPPKIQRMWMHVWMSVYKKTEDESRAFKAANAILKRNMTKYGMSRYGHGAYMSYMVDKWLGNLPG